MGITDRPRAPIIAKAKIGERGPKGEPRRLDYIIFVEPQTGRRLPEYQAIFGDRPTSFNALLPADRLEDVVDVAWKRYGKLGLKCRGDGERGLDRETGEGLACAGEYNADDPAKHKCPHARPKDGRPPECKPVLSMRLVVPRVPGLGVVQLDTGGVASSIPTLVAQLRMIEDMTRDERGEPHMAGIAVKVLIRAFRDRMGNAAYGWQLEPLSQAEAANLRAGIEGLVRLEGQVNMQALPPIDELPPEPDIYGLAEGDELPALEPAETEQDLLEAAQANVPAEVQNLEAMLCDLLTQANIPTGKHDSILSLMSTNRAKAARANSYAGYQAWLMRQIDRMPLKGADND